jgi:predicted amidophosphoribosyltransferase
MKCPACEQDNPSGKKFCGDCGAALESLCPQCRTGSIWWRMGLNSGDVVVGKIADDLRME